MSQHLSIFGKRKMLIHCHYKSSLPTQSITALQFAMSLLLCFN